MQPVGPSRCPPVPPTLARSPVAVPMLTHELPGIGGVIKQSNEDFMVEEVPLYPFSGEGTHVLFAIEKSGIDTQGALRLLSAELGCRPNDIGIAGLKDAHAITRQWMSLEHADPDQIAHLETSQLKVVEVTRHTNKLKVGHLKGNRFRIRVRQLGPPSDLGPLLPASEALKRAREICDVLTRRGVPNYFGPQRFGSRQDSHVIGRAVLTQDADLAVRRLLGETSPRDHGKVRHARKLFEAGHLEQAMDAWPRSFRTERALLRELIRQEGKVTRRLLRAIGPVERKFFLSAYQSALFNFVLADRVERGAIDQLQPGDIAVRHIGGAVFKVVDVSREQPRVEAGEISPSGPLFGRRGSIAEGDAGKLERELLNAEQLGTGDPWKVPGGPIVAGDRRSFRVIPEELKLRVGSDDDGPYLEVEFFLIKGAYATCLLAELCKVAPDVILTPPAPPADTGESADEIASGELEPMADE